MFLHVEKGAVIPRTLVTPQLEFGKYSSVSYLFKSYIPPEKLSDYRVDYYNWQTGVREQYDVQEGGEVSGIVSHSPNTNLTVYRKEPVLVPLLQAEYYEGRLVCKTDELIPESIFTDELSFVDDVGYGVLSSSETTFDVSWLCDYYKGSETGMIIAIDLTNLGVDGYCIALYTYDGGWDSSSNSPIKSETPLEMLYSTTDFDLENLAPGLKADKVGWQKEQSDEVMDEWSYWATYSDLADYFSVLSTSCENIMSISVEYNKDINKEIERLTRAIISLGGNI